MKLIIKFFVLVMSFAGNVQAATVTFDPNPQEISLGNIFTLDVIGLGFSGTEGGGAKFSFNPAILRVNSVTVDSAVWDIYTASGLVDNINGSVTGITVATFNDPGSEFIVASIIFEAIGLGSTSLQLAENPLNPWASLGSVINPTLIDGSVTVVVPLPEAVWLFGVGLAVLGAIGKRESS